MGKKQTDVELDVAVAVLFWLKVLNDFKDGKFENATFNEKYMAFEAVEDAGVSRKEYEDCIEYWVKKKVLKRNIFTRKLKVSDKGKRLFAELDNQTQNEVNELLKQLGALHTLKEILKFVQEHYADIISTLGVILSIVQIVLN